MKNIFILIFLLPFFGSAQVYETAEKSMTGIFEFPNKSGTELYSSVSRWVVLNYNSATYDVLMKDRENRTLIVSGIHKIEYKNFFELLYPKNNKYPEFDIIHLNYTLEINTKDNKLRIIYRLGEITDESNQPMNELFNNCISLDGTNENAINDWKKNTDRFIQINTIVGKSKRENYLSNAKNRFDLINQSIISHIKETMNSLNDIILNSQKEELNEKL